MANDRLLLTCINSNIGKHDVILTVQTIKLKLKLRSNMKKPVISLVSLV